MFAQEMSQHIAGFEEHLRAVRDGTETRDGTEMLFETRDVLVDCVFTLSFTV